jgi:hypothetical protein
VCAWERTERKIERGIEREKGRERENAPHGRKSAQSDSLLQVILRSKVVRRDELIERAVGCGFALSLPKGTEAVTSRFRLFGLVLACDRSNLYRCAASHRCNWRIEKA